MNKKHQALIRETLFEGGTYCPRKWRAASTLVWLQNYDGDVLSEKVWNVLYVRPLCHCGNKTRYINFNEGYRMSCSAKCAQGLLAQSKSARHSDLWNNPKWVEKTSLRMKQAHFNARVSKKLAELLEKQIVPLDELKPGFDNEYRWQHSCGEIFVKSFKRTFSIYCPKCHVSKGQGELYEFIRRHYNGEIIVNDRTKIAPLEIDIYLPELQLGFEFNGKYWHTSGGVREEAKCFEAQEVGVKIVNVWEVEWNKNKDKTKQEVLSYLPTSVI